MKIFLNNLRSLSASVALLWLVGLSSLEAQGVHIVIDVDDTFVVERARTTHLDTSEWRQIVANGITHYVQPHAVDVVEDFLRRGYKVSFFTYGIPRRIHPLLEAIKLSDGRSLRDAATFIRTAADLSSEGPTAMQKDLEKIDPSFAQAGSDLVVMIDNDVSVIPSHQLGHAIWFRNLNSRFFDIVRPAALRIFSGLRNSPAHEDINAYRWPWVRGLVLEILEASKANEESPIQTLTRMQWIPVEPIVELRKLETPSPEIYNISDPSSGEVKKVWKHNTLLSVHPALVERGLAGLPKAPSCRFISARAHQYFFSRTRTE